MNSLFALSRQSGAYNTSLRSGCGISTHLSKSLIFITGTILRLSDTNWPQHLRLIWGNRCLGLSEKEQQHMYTISSHANKQEQEQLLKWGQCCKTVKTVGRSRFLLHYHLPSKTSHNQYTGLFRRNWESWSTFWKHYHIIISYHYYHKSKKTGWYNIHWS